ncbi:MAG: hypothetical protein ABIL69_02370 [candidate division WOR-3 bacterium]
MKLQKINKIIIIFFALNLVFGLDWSGYFSTDHRFLIKEYAPLSFEEYRLTLNPQQSIYDNIKFSSEIWLRSSGLPEIENLDDLFTKDRITPFEIDIREAYIDILKFPVENIDMRIGRQRIAWGTADKINPTDNLNPLDLEDIWDFGRHLGSNGIKIEGYIKDFNLSYIFIPRFTPALLPQNALYTNYSNITLPPGINPAQITNSISMPDYNIKNSIQGLRVKKNLFNFDFSMSYVYGRDGIPILKNTTIIPVDMLGNVNIYNELAFPKMQIFGMDFAGAIGDIGIWAEGALFLPESIHYEIDLSQLGMGVLDSLILDKKPYAKFVLGSDYTFKNGIYINLQYVHGFFQERGKEIEDYILLGLEWKLFEDKLKLMPLAGGFEIKDFSDFKNNYAFVYAPEISYKPVENCELILGARVIDGKEITNFGRLKQNDEFVLKARYSF